uniref:P-type ATPase C-terminal domain-containing protein n=1 Tax=Acrobeloides nanus TaxID=290746 RepID=A0A914CBY7_9BILA
MFIYVMITTIGNLIVACIFFLQGFYFIPNAPTTNIYYKLAEHIFRLIVASWVMIYPIILILSHKILQRKFVETIFKKPTIFKQPQQENVLGDRLIMNAEGNDYFKNLENQWNNTYFHDGRYENLSSRRDRLIRNRINPKAVLNLH